MKKLLKESVFVDVFINYYKGFWLPIKGYFVLRGMVVEAIKK